MYSNKTRNIILLLLCSTIFFLTACAPSMISIQQVQGNARSGLESGNSITTSLSPKEVKSILKTHAIKTRFGQQEHVYTAKATPTNISPKILQYLFVYRRSGRFQGQTIKSICDVQVKNNDTGAEVLYSCDCNVNSLIIPRRIVKSALVGDLNREFSRLLHPND